MSDFNTMFEEQVEMQSGIDTTGRILEAMLKRDQLEIEYRNQGISESKIAEFHEAATNAINEGLGSFIKNSYNKFTGKKKEEPKKDGKWYNKVWDAVVAAYEKFMAWLKNIWAHIQAFFMKESNFIKKYEDKLIKHKNDKEITSIKIMNVRAFDTSLLIDFDPSKDYTFWDAKTELCKNYNPDNGEITIGNDLKDMIDFFKKGLETKTSKQVEDYANHAKTKIQSLATSDKENADTQRKRAYAYLRYIQAFNASLIKERKTNYKNCKSGILKAIAVINSIKESTINFMVEACNIDIDKIFAPIVESSDLISNYLTEKTLGDRVSDLGAGFSHVGNKVKDKLGFGKKEEKPGLGKRIWDAIVKAFNNFVIWIKKIWYTMINMFKSAKDVVEKYKGAVSKLSRSEYENIMVIKIKNDDADVRDFNSGFMEPSRKSAEEWKSIAEKYNASIESEKVKLTDVGLGEVIKYLENPDNAIASIKQRISDAEKAKTNAEKSVGDSDQYSACLSALRACASRQLKIAKMKLGSYRSAFMQCVALTKKPQVQQSMALVESYNENYNVELNYQVECLLQEAEEIDALLDTAASQDSMGVGDVNLASTEVLQPGASNDPFALDYEKTHCFSQTVDMGDEGIAGTIGAELGDTDTSVKSGNETPSVTKEAYDFINSLAEAFA